MCEKTGTAYASHKRHLQASVDFFPGFSKDEDDPHVGPPLLPRGAIRYDDTLVAGANTDAYYRTQFPQGICGPSPVLRGPT
jgi:hypothetical protein